VADEFLRVGRTAIGAQGRFTVALSGGSTPRALYTLLAKDHTDFTWARTHLFFGDERHVPPDHSDSNYRMVNESLLSRIQIPAENLHRVHTENADAKQAAADYEAEIHKFFELRGGELPRFDLILLGLGPDGHTASLFPDSEGLKERSKLVVANWAEKFKTYRISFTFPVLNNSSEVIFLVSGSDKAEIVGQILTGNNTPPFPAQQILPSNGKLLWMLDEAAASHLAR
jgi:6-phosphogluconolactonase